MRRVILFLLVAFVTVTFLCAESFYSDSVSTNPSITMILKPMETSGTTVGFSSTSSDDGLSPITGTQSLELKYDKIRNAEVTAGKTIYPYWVVTGQSTQVTVKLAWTVLDSSGSNVTENIFNLTDSSNTTLESGMTLATVSWYNTDVGSTEIIVSTVALNEKPYDEVYTLRFTLTAEGA